ncbi:MAG: protease complex subunit PrcB family protein [Elusimicrobia bacterium]|nr:protease complex subunit PrcB family protein [Elusimicrobiota bacterium]
MGKRPEQTKTQAENQKTMREETNPIEWPGESGQFCNQEQASARIVENESQWRDLWYILQNQRVEPKIDFNKYFVAAVFLGSRPTGGYSIQFLEPKSEKDKTIVQYRVKAPGNGSFVIQALTQPYAIRLIPKPNTKIELREVP